MIPLVDMHCHLLAGLDDGPRSQDDALAMCRMAYGEGVRMVAALAHQNDRWDQVTPDRIRTATQELARQLQEAGLELTVFPTAEVTAHPELEASWLTGRLLSIADRGQYLLLEMPHGLFVDLRPLLRRLRERSLRVILAHPERHPELLHEVGAIEQLIDEGCLIQVSSASVTKPACRRDAKALQSWFRRDCVHLLGSDGHSPRRRPPEMAAAYRQVQCWAGDAVADRVCSTNGLAILRGQPVQIAPPRRKMTLFGLPLW
jgi:protein-tyrosine phosphatase